MENPISELLKKMCKDVALLNLPNVYFFGLESWFVNENEVESEITLYDKEMQLLLPNDFETDKAIEFVKSTHNEVCVYDYLHNVVCNEYVGLYSPCSFVMPIDYFNE